MKCPECGLVLVKTAVVGMDDSYRCGNCGGVWAKAWVINAIAGEPYHELGVMRYPSAKHRTSGGEKLKCPADGTWLSLSHEETLPPDVPMWQCDKCKCWWLPGNSVFDLAEAFRIKAEFTKRWRKNEPAGSMVLPVILTIILAIGLGVAVTVIRNQQQVSISAGSAVIGKPMVIFTGDNKAEIRFRSAGDIQKTDFKREKDAGWLPAYVMNEGDWKVFMVYGVNPGEKLWVLIDLRAWQLTIGQKQ